MTRTTRSLFITIGLALLVSVAIIIAAGALGVTAPGILSIGTAFWLVGAAVITLLIAVPLTLWASDRQADATVASEARLRSEMASQILDARVEARDDLADVSAQHDGRIETLEHDVARMQGRVHAVEEVAAGAATEGAAIAADERDAVIATVTRDVTRSIAAIKDDTATQWQHHETVHAKDAEAVADLRNELDATVAALSANVDLRFSDHEAVHAEEHATATAAQEETTRRLAEHRASIEDRLQSHEEAIGQTFDTERQRTDADIHDLRDALHRQEDHVADQFLATQFEIQQTLVDQEAFDDALASQDERIHAALYEATTASEAATSADSTSSKLTARVERIEGHGAQDQTRGLQAMIEGLQAQLTETQGALRKLQDHSIERAAAQQEQFLEFQEEVRSQIQRAGVGRAVAVRQENGITVTADSPFGKVYPVHEVEGIGNKTSYTLQKQGILDTEHLWHADTQAIATELGITARQVRQWQTQAELMAVNGIGRQWSELMAVSGVTSISHLAGLQARELLDLLEHSGKIRDHHVQKGRIGQSMCEEWIRKAREHAPEKSIHV